MPLRIIKVNETFEIRGERITVEVERMIDTYDETTIFNEKIDDIAVTTALNEYRRRHHYMTTTEIIALRHNLKLTQTEFSELLGCSTSTIMIYEHGGLPSESDHNRLCELQRAVQ